MVDEGRATPEVTRVVRLLRAGLNGIEIAERLGLARSTVYQHLVDPLHVKADERRHRHRGTCQDCGGPTFNGGSTKHPLPKRCDSCERSRNLDQNERIIELWEKGWKAREIASEVGLSETAVGSRIDMFRRRQGVPVQLHRLRNREAWPTIERMWNKGAHIADIALAVDSTPASVRMMVRTMRRQGINLIARSSAPPVNHARREFIVRHWAEGLSTAAIAEELGIAPTSLGCVISKLRKKGYDLPYRRADLVNH